MKICYIDESGCSGALPAANSPIQPALVICGLFLDVARLKPITYDFLNLKKTYFPAAMSYTGHFLDLVLDEVKGAEIRRDAAEGSKRRRRHSMRFISDILELLERHHCRIAGRIWIKPIGQPFDGNAVYTSSVQFLSTTFQAYLDAENDLGFQIADNSMPNKNRLVAHSIFTQKFRANGDPYPRLMELTTFGISDNHAGVQLCDLVASAIVFPIAVQTYCTGHVQNLHIRPRYSTLKQQFSERLENLQFRYQVPLGKWTGGLVVSDPLGKQHSGMLFK